MTQPLTMPAPWNLPAHKEEALIQEDIAEILAGVVRSGASDIIISESRGAWVIRHGQIEQFDSIPRDKARTLFFTALERMAIDTNNLQGAAYETSVAFHEFRFRISAFTDIEGGRLVMRVLSTEIPDPCDINVPPSLLHTAVTCSNGLILICGPTGCGKTTTIASILAKRGEMRQEHVVTLEDPVEYILPSHTPSVFTQREIGRDEPSFAHGLKAALRQSPHVIVIGEIRDPETAATALEAAETGHLVIATIHANSADTTAHRYIQMVPSDRQHILQEQLATNTQAIVCQHLFPAEGGHRGRVAIHELMVKTHATVNCIRQGQWAELRNEMAYGHKKGHITFDRSAKELLEKGIIQQHEYRNMIEWITPRETSHAGISNHN